MGAPTSTSIYEVMARIVRNTRLQDTSYIEDMKEWIPEAMGMMRVKIQTWLRWADLQVKFHKHRMPCGSLGVVAVQYGGGRLRWYNGSRAADGMNMSTLAADSVYPGIPTTDAQPWGQYVVKRGAEDDGIPVNFYETDIRRLCALDWCADGWYYTEMDCIITSMADACIRVHYRCIPVDERGLPIIPDEENYKEALYWYTRGKMIGAGYEDKQFTEDKCMDRFDNYAIKARSKATRKGTDEMETMVDNFQRLLMPADMWSSFNNPVPEGGYDFNGGMPLVF